MRVIDSHTGGEPTRVVVDAADLVHAETPEGYRAALSRDADWLRTSLTHEPRGAPWMVGALLTPPHASDSAAGVVFFNNAGYLGMCGHGLIGVVATMAHLGRIATGDHVIETPVGPVAARLHDDGLVGFENVPSYVHAADISVVTETHGEVRGDVVYGGNWFFLARHDGIATAPVSELKRKSEEIARGIQRQALSGRDGAAIDHVELYGPSSYPAMSDGKNFVLCPGGEIDRSPCGTGTSAKLASLAHRDELGPGDVWRQESITGSVFEGSYRRTSHGVVPTIRGRAHLTADSELLIDPADPMRHGFLLESSPVTQGHEVEP